MASFTTLATFGLNHLFHKKGPPVSAPAPTTPLGAPAPPDARLAASSGVLSAQLAAKKARKQAAAGTAASPLMPLLGGTPPTAGGARKGLIGY
jgi:hypothetical protein